MAITPLELLSLVLIGGAPAFLVTTGLQCHYGRRRAALSWIRTAFLAALTLLFALPVTVGVWAILPSWILARLPSPHPGVALLWSILLVPSLVGSVVGIIGARLFVTRLRRLAPA